MNTQLQQSKRRRLTSPTKPFRSPLLKSNTAAEKNSQSSEQVPELSTQKAETRNNIASARFSTSTPTSTAATPHTDPESARTNPTQRTLTNSKKIHATSFQEIRALRAEIDKISQATALRNNSQDEELKKLICKWRSVSQAAAEEVFVFMKDRVDSLGGMKQLRKEEIAASRRKRALEDDSFGALAVPAPAEFDQDGQKSRSRQDAARDRVADSQPAERLHGGLDEEGDELRQLMKRDDEDEEAHNTFTMEMMLRRLNIDFDVIGYDLKEERWRDE